jgi:hypothetical protein
VMAAWWRRWRVSSSLVWRILGLRSVEMNMNISSVASSSSRVLRNSMYAVSCFGSLKLMSGYLLALAYRVFSSPLRMWRSNTLGSLRWVISGIWSRYSLILCLESVLWLT